MMSEALWMPVVVAIGGLIFWAGVMFARVDSLREWRNAQQHEAAELKLAQARLAEGHVGVVQTLAFLQGMLDRRTPTHVPGIQPNGGVAGLDKLK